MFIKVKYIDNPNEYKFDSIESITDNENVICINCRNNKLTSLPENMNFPNLQRFGCGNNQLTSLPKNMNLPNLQGFYCSDNKLTSLPENFGLSLPNLRYFDCGNNQLTSLPENMNLPNLQEFYCNDNKLTSLPENFSSNFPNLQYFDCGFNQLTLLPENISCPNLTNFYCYRNQLTLLPDNFDSNFPNLRMFNCNVNKLTSLPENMILPNLQEFCCGKNQLTFLPENMNFPNLQEFRCYDNQLTSLPICILNWRNLKRINYSGNEIALSPQIARFISRVIFGSVTKINVYGDTQNVHNTSIQCSVRDSINRLTTRLDLPKFDAEILNTMILCDDTLSEHVKSRLIEYCSDDSVHSLLLLTFTDVLWYVLNTITYDFKDSPDTQNEIKHILNQEILDAECKCFTGRMNRVVNCLNGFSPLVDIRISDGEQIGNVIIMLKDKALDADGNYSVTEHKRLVEHELQERGYDSETVTQWLEYIE